MSIQLWNHKRSGESYVVEFNNGTVTEACGPLYYADIPEVMQNNFVPNSDPELAEWMTENQEEFVLSQVH